MPLPPPNHPRLLPLHNCSPIGMPTPVPPTAPPPPPQSASPPPHTYTHLPPPPRASHNPLPHAPADPTRKRFSAPLPFTRLVWGASSAGPVVDLGMGGRERTRALERGGIGCSFEEGVGGFACGEVVWARLDYVRDRWISTLLPFYFSFDLLR